MGNAKGKSVNAKSIDIYEADYQKIAAKKKPQFVSPAENLVRAVRHEKLEIGTDRVALDFGCGDGRNCQYLHNLGYQVVALDFSQGALNATRARFDDGDVELLFIEEKTAVPILEESLDFIVAWEIMHWLGYEKIFDFYMADFKRLMRPDAKLVMTMPTEDHFLSRDSIQSGRSEFVIQHPTRNGCPIYSPNLRTLHEKIGTLEMAITRTLRYDLYDSVPFDGLGYPFSMYVFCLENS